MIPEEKNVSDGVIATDAQRSFEDELLTSVVKHFHQKVLSLEGLLIVISTEQTLQKGVAFAWSGCRHFFRVASLRPSARFCSINIEFGREALDPNDVLSIVHLFDMCPQQLQFPLERKQLMIGAFVRVVDHDM